MPLILLSEGLNIGYEFQLRARNLVARRNFIISQKDVALMQELKASEASRAMSLCYIVNYDYNVLGGAMTRFRSEVEYFSSKGYPVSVVFSSSQSGESYRKNGVNFINIRHFRHELVIFTIRLFFECLRRRLSSGRSVFIANNPISSIPPSLLRFIGLGSNSVLIMHGPSAVEISLKGNKTKAVLQSVVDRIAFTLASKVVAISEYERNYAIRLKTNPKKVVIIRNGVEFPESMEHSAFRQEMNIPQDCLVIGYLGSWVAYRGTEFLVQGFSIAKKMTKTPLALVLVLKEKLSKEEIARINEFAGEYRRALYLSEARKDVSLVLSALDIYASHFSKKVDGIGFSIMEAMASSLPVITGKDYIATKLLKNRVDAVLVEKENPRQIAEAIKNLAEAPLLRKKIGSNARRTALEKFSRSRMLTLCEREYLNVVSR